MERVNSFINSPLENDQPNKIIISKNIPVFIKLNRTSNGLIIANNNIGTINKGPGTSKGFPIIKGPSETLSFGTSRGAYHMNGASNLASRSIKTYGSTRNLAGPLNPVNSKDMGNNSLENVKSNNQDNLPQHIFLTPIKVTTKPRFGTVIDAQSSNHPKALGVNLSTPFTNIPFKLSTKTQFGTVIDPQSPTLSATTSKFPTIQSLSAAKRDHIEFTSEVIPREAPILKKIKISTNNVLKGRSTAVVSASPAKSSSQFISGDSEATTPSKSLQSGLLSSLEEIQDAETTGADTTNDEYVRSDKTFKKVVHLEALQLANSKQNSEIIVALRKLNKRVARISKFDEDDEEMYDEIKRILPVKTLEHLNSFDHRVRTDSEFRKKVKAYLRGFKESGLPKNVNSVLRKIMTDNLIFDFNYKGVMGKKSLVDYYLVDIIREMYNPMADEIFDGIMRATVKCAKLRYNNNTYVCKKRQNNEQQSKLL